VLDFSFRELYSFAVTLWCMYLSHLKWSKKRKKGKKHNKRKEK